MSFQRFSRPKYDSYHVGEKSYGSRSRQKKPEHLKNLPPVLINTLARIFTRYLSECKVPNSGRPARPCCCIKGDPHDIGNYRPIAYCPSSTSSSQE
ncbi:hypothetical protein RB195_010755 [Necator americanus]|uniref:Uncharacterized protein n=1 Tax=Necator americanus TaxID=51031 RepID=A0ABR1CZC2_NECAM